MKTGFVNNKKATNYIIEWEIFTEHLSWIVTTLTSLIIYAEQRRRVYSLNVKRNNSLPIKQIFIVQNIFCLHHNVCLVLQNLFGTVNEVRFVLYVHEVGYPIPIIPLWLGSILMIICEDGHSTTYQRVKQSIWRPIISLEMKTKQGIRRCGHWSPLPHTEYE